MTEPVTFDTSAVRPMMVVPILYGVSGATYFSSLETQAACIRNGIDLRIVPVAGVRYVPEARSRAADHCLKSDATHLFFVDHDMAWKAQDAIRFMMLGTEMEVLCAAYPYNREPARWMLEMAAPAHTNAWGCFPFRGRKLGLGFSIIRRDVIERLAAAAPKVHYADGEEPMAAIFEIDVVDGVFRGEDMNFFAKVEALGLTVWLDPSIELGHVGEKEYRGRLGDHLQAGPA